MTDTPTPTKLRRPVTEEEVLDWWEAYEEGGLSIDGVAEIFVRTTTTIRKHFRELGTLKGATECSTR